jgi:hypothetical protein
MYALRRRDVIQKPNPSRRWIRRRIGFRDRASLRKIGWVRTQPNHLSGSYFSDFFFRMRILTKFKAVCTYSGLLRTKWGGGTFFVRITCPDFPRNVIRIPDCCRRIKFYSEAEKNWPFHVAEGGWEGFTTRRPKPRDPESKEKIPTR